MTQKKPFIPTKDEKLKGIIKDATKEAIKEAFIEFEQFKKKRRSTKDPDLISTTEAYNLRGRARVSQLILLGLLPQVSSGNSKNSAKYVSKKKLFQLDKVCI